MDPPKITQGFSELSLSDGILGAEASSAASLVGGFHFLFLLQKS